MEQKAQQAADEAAAASMAMAREAEVVARVEVTEVGNAELRGELSGAEERIRALEGQLALAQIEAKEAAVAAAARPEPVRVTTDF